jgi:hypothetical protein
MSQLKPFAGKLQSFSGGISFTDQIKAGFHLQMSEVQAAIDIRQTLELSKLLISVAIANSKDWQEYRELVTDIVNALKFTQDKGAVGIEVTIYDSMFQKGIKKKATP